MPFSIQFIRGSLAGRRFPVGTGELLVGRSHSCSVRPKEDDVSGRHVSLAAAGEALAVTVLSRHRTRIDGKPAKPDGVFALSAGSIIELGATLAFKVIDDSASHSPDDTSTMPGTGTDTLSAATGTGTAMPTAATRFGGTLSGAAPVSGTATLSEQETGTIPGSGTETLSAATGMATAMPTAATRFGGDDTVTGTGTGSRTAATSFASETGEGETAIFDGGSSSSSEGAAGTDSGIGETQMLQTQAASMEELEKLKAAYQQKRARRTAIRFTLLGAAAIAAVCASIMFSMRKPEKVLSMPSPRKSVSILPELAPNGVKDDLRGNVGLSYPVSGSREKRSSGDGVTSLQVTTRLGRDLDVEVVLAVDVFEDEKALFESRWDTFNRYISGSSELVKILDNMYPLPDEDFFGGFGGICRGIPCSRVEYWRMRGSENVYGVVSFFRSGTLCCALRREVPAAEKERASSLLVWTRVWLYADRAGAFGAAQWEGAENAGCADPALEIVRCESRFAVDSPAEWPEIEQGIRNILAETHGDEAYGDVRSRAFKLLLDLRTRKVLHWKRLVSSRVPLTLSGATEDKARAAELDEDVRNNFKSSDEEWHFLARRVDWWKE